MTLKEFLECVLDLVETEGNHVLNLEIETTKYEEYVECVDIDGISLDRNKVSDKQVVRIW